MGFFSLLLLSVALAMDAFSVAVTDGMILNNMRIRDALKIGILFGLFQFLMPCIGSGVSSLAADYIESFDHWIVFFLLSFLGIKMIIDSRKEQEIPKNPLSLASLLLMAAATSIDALAAGVSLAAIGAPIFFSCSVIGITAFLFSFSGAILGRRFGSRLEGKAEIAGGVVLILIGLKTLIEHLFSL